MCYLFLLIDISFLDSEQSKEYFGFVNDRLYFLLFVTNFSVIILNLIDAWWRLFVCILCKLFIVENKRKKKKLDDLLQ